MPTSGKFLNFRIANQNGYHIELSNTQLSHSTEVEQVWTMLTKYGFDGGHGSAMRFQGGTIENVMIAGRWRNMFTPMHYRNTFVNFRLDLVKNLPHV